jgi:hypothetical protein
MPEWHLLTLALGALSVASIKWAALRLALPLFVTALLIPLGFAAHAVRGMFGSGVPRRMSVRFKLRALTGALHVVQPLARLLGRLSNGLPASRRIMRPAFALPRSRECRLWSERWRDPSAWLSIVEESMRSTCHTVRRGGDFDHWDLEARSGVFTTVRALLGVEEHGTGRQLIRIRFSSRATRVGVATASVLASTLLAAAVSRSWVSAASSYLRRCFSCSLRSMKATSRSRSATSRSRRSFKPLVVCPYARTDGEYSSNGRADVMDMV